MHRQSAAEAAFLLPLRGFSFAAARLFFSLH